MSNEENKFDDLLRSKLSEREFFFDELNWSKAEQSIIREEKARKLRRTALIFLGGVIIGAAIMLPVANILNNNKGVTSAGNGHSSTNNGLSQGLAANTTINSANHTAGRSQPGNSIAQGTAPATITSNSSPALAHQTMPVVDITPSNNKTVGNSHNNYDYASASAGKKHKKYASGIAAADATSHLHNGSNLPTVASTETKQNTPRLQATQAGSNSTTGNKPLNATSVNTSPEENNASMTSIQQNNSPSTNGVQGNANNQTALTPPATSQTTQTSATQNNTALNNQANTTTQGTTNAGTSNSQSQANPSSPNTSTNITQSGSPPLMPPVNATNSKSNSSFTIASIELGGGYAFGWANEGSRQGNGISPVAGIRLEHSFGNRVVMYIGVRYNMLTNLQSSYSSTSGTYDFGLNNNTTTVSPQLLHYLAVPLGLQYSFNDKDAIYAGGTALYLVNTTSEVTSTTYDGIKQPVSQKKTSFGYTDGFNTWNAQLVVAYRRRLFKGFALSAEGYYGLMDIENSSLFGNNIFERDSGVRLVLSYDIIK